MKIDFSKLNIKKWKIPLIADIVERCVYGVLLLGMGKYIFSQLRKIKFRVKEQ